MFFAKGILYFILGVCLLFFLLGLKSQKGEAKGLVDGRLADAGNAPNCALSEAGTQSERAVMPLSASLQQAKAAIIATGGTITSETDNYISATYMSKVFKFVDDVELRAESNGGEGDVVHIRSCSRVGYSDRGENKKRIKAIRAAL